MIRVFSADYTKKDYRLLMFALSAGLKIAARNLDYMVGRITGAVNVTATIRIPDKFNPYVKS